MSNIHVLHIFVYNVRYLPAPTMKLWGGVLIFGQKFTKYPGTNWYGVVVVSNFFINFMKYTN